MKHLKTLLAVVLGLALAGNALADSVLPTQTLDQALHAKLPQDIQQSGRIISVNNGSFPPYEIAIGTHSLEGASADLADALAQLLGVKIEHASVSGLSGVLSGINSGRYQMAIGPIGDFPDREQKNDLIDFVKEFVVFAVPKGNPSAINSLDDTCGKRIAVMAAGSAEQVIRRQSSVCVAAGKPAVTVASFTDQPTSVLAVRSGRVDAFFSSQAPLTYFVAQTNGQLELSGLGRANGFGDLYQGSVVPKDSPLGAVVLEAYQKLFDNGTYAAVMKKWHLEGNMLKAPGRNLAGAGGAKP